MLFSAMLLLTESLLDTVLYKKKVSKNTFYSPAAVMTGGSSKE